MAVLSRGIESRERRREAEASFLAATEELLASGNSYAELSVERIAAAAGRSRTAFYLYFRDKRDLLMRLTEAVAETLYDEADRWWSGTDGRRELRAALADEQVGRFWRQLVGRFVEATERRLVADGEDAVHAAGKAFALTWMVERACHQQVARGAPLDDQVLVDALVEIWERSVYAAGA